MKTSDLIGPALDWAVARCENVEDQGEGFIWFDDHDRLVPYSPSTDWAQGGPIIEREKIDLEGRWNTRGCGVRTGFKEWYANHPKNHGGLIHYIGYGPTPLVAAMRCYVASVLGDEVEIPEELK